MDENTRLLTKIATLYYKNELTQAQVAKRLGLSRQSVGRSLKRAQESGIVEIKIHSPLSLSAELESQVEKAFHLREVIVVQPPPTPKNPSKKRLAPREQRFSNVAYRTATSSASPGAARSCSARCIWGKWGPAR